MTTERLEINDPVDGTTSHPCDICGTLVDMGSEPMTYSGWYSGHEYIWHDGQAKLIRVRCENHPYDDRAEGARQSAEEDAIRWHNYRIEQAEEQPQ